MIKGYTDKEQSKKLAEILPIESADMIYAPFGDTHPWVWDGERKHLLEKDSIPCWSLSALVNVLPRIDIEKEIWSSDKYDYRVKAFIGDGYVGDWYDNPVDACYKMIVKLKEHNLI